MGQAHINLLMKYRYVLVFGILGLFAAFDVIPKIRDILELNGRLKEIKARPLQYSQMEKDQQERQYAAELAAYQKGIRILKDVCDEARPKILKEKNIAEVTLAIEDMASSSKIELSSIKPKPSEAGPQYEVVPIEIGFQGGYLQLIDFLSELEKQDILLVVDNLTIRSGAGEAAPLDIHLTTKVPFAVKAPAEREDGLSEGGRP